MRLSQRAMRGLAGGGLAGALGLACGPAVSLDDPGPGSVTPSTSAGSLGTGSTGDGDGTAASEGLDGGERLDLGGIRLDVAPNLPLPPGVCPPDCQFELNRAWSYDGPGSEPPTPLDPEDRVAVLVELDDRVVVAEERQGAITLARLDVGGQELWTLPLALPCEPCRLVDLRRHPSGDLLLSARGVDELDAPVAVAARVELDGPTLRWATATTLTIVPGVAPRAGTVVARDQDLLLQPVIEGSLVDGLERLELLTYDATDGAVVLTTELAAGTGTSDAPPPRAAHDARGLLVITRPVWSGGDTLSGEIRWVSPMDDSTLVTAPRVEPSLRLAAAPGGRMLTLGRTHGRDAIHLRLGSGYVDVPELWTLTEDVQTVTNTSPALAVDAYGDAHVVVRTGRGEPGREDDVELLVLRWSDQGTPVWRLALPLAFDRVNEPISLGLTADEDLVLGGFLAGVRHVERRWPNCNCG